MFAAATLGVAAAVWLVRAERGAHRAVFRSGGVELEASGETLVDGELAPRRGFVRGAPMSNALLEPNQDPRSFAGAFRPTLVRYDEDGEPVTYRALFRSNKYAEFRQTLLDAAFTKDGEHSLELEVKVDGARTTNGREYWLTLEPTGLGDEGFSVAVDGAFDRDSGRLDVVVDVRLPGGEPIRYRFAFRIDDTNHFTPITA